jgi:hypothetical protein
MTNGTLIFDTFIIVLNFIVAKVVENFANKTYPYKKKTILGTILF